MKKIGDIPLERPSRLDDVTCPFCQKTQYHMKVILPFQTAEGLSPEYTCQCGAIWYDAIEEESG